MFQYLSTTNAGLRKSRANRMRTSCSPLVEGESIVGGFMSARLYRWARSMESSASADATASRTDADTRMLRPCSSHVYHDALTPARTATSSRRSPGVLRRPWSGRPTSPGFTFARLALRNSLICSLRSVKLELDIKLPRVDIKV